MGEHSITAYPLSWPAGQPRTPGYKRKNGPFKLPREKVDRYLFDQLRLMGATRIVVSTNQVLNARGLPHGGRSGPADGAVALYFHRKGRQLCLACDQYLSIADNLRAISLTLEALRGIERWGGAQLMDRAFTGFAALPAPMECAAPWYEVLGVTPEATEDGIRTARVSLARRYHPDSGSEPNAEKMKAVNAAAEVGLSLRRGAQGGSA